MKNLNILPFFIVFSLVSSLFAQDDIVVEEPTTVEALLSLVKEGKTREQSENAEREKKFLLNKNKQASILAAEKRELARQEKKLLISSKQITKEMKKL
jgi:biopolymer transport protein ExbB